MRGYTVTDTPGYDTHGLPIEVQMEKELGIKNLVGKSPKKISIKVYLDKKQVWLLGMPRQR